MSFIGQIYFAGVFFKNKNAKSHPNQKWKNRHDLIYISLSKIIFVEFTEPNFNGTYQYFWCKETNLSLKKYIIVGQRSTRLDRTWNLFWHEKLISVAKPIQLMDMLSLSNDWSYVNTDHNIMFLCQIVNSEVHHLKRISER